MWIDLFATTTFPLLHPFPFRCGLPSPPRFKSPFPPLSAHRGLLARFHRLQATHCLRRHLVVYACCVSGDGELDSSASLESETFESTNPKEAAFDLKLPRRNLLVKFTCNSCGERTQRMINRLAYERGTVFIQAHHSTKDLGQLHHFLGLEITMSSSGINLSQ